MCDNKIMKGMNMYLLTIIFIMVSLAGDVMAGGHRRGDGPGTDGSGDTQHEHVVGVQYE